MVFVIGPHVTERLKARYWRKVQRAGPNDCWEWLAGRNALGYGAFGVDGRTRMATHVALTLDGRPRPGALIALHSCDNPGCVNPQHLRWGTDAENQQDMIDRGRARRLFGEDHWMHKRPERIRRRANHPRAKLTEADVREIRAAPRHRGTGIELAARFGVRPAAISKIRLGQLWPAQVLNQGGSM